MRNYHAHSIGIIAAFSISTLAMAQATNGDGTDGSGINSPGTGPRTIQRLLSAPRFDPSTAAARHLTFHFRSFDNQNQNDYREFVTVYTDGVPNFTFGELDPASKPVDENGNTLDLDGNGVEDLWGGAAYRWTDKMVLQAAQTPYLSGSVNTNPSMFLQTPEYNTFGGVTINGGSDAADFRIAFFAGVVDPSDSTATNRQQPPIHLNDRSNFDPDLIGSKTQPLRRGIWSSVEASGLLRLRALENDPTRVAPPDPDPNMPLFDRQFTRLHPSDYGVGTQSTSMQGSLMAEQRFSRVSNIALNTSGALAFRGDVGNPATAPILAIWADRISIGGGHTLHRVFIENDSSASNAQIAFDNDASNDPAVSYRIVIVGAPAFTANEDATTPEPLVAAYAVLRGNNAGGGLRPPASAIIARQPGSSGSGGFQPKILAIEGEPFNVYDPTGSVSPTTTFSFVNSIDRSDGLPGLADVAERTIDGDGKFRNKFKLTQGLEPSFSVYKPRPTINEQNEIAFLGRIATIDGVEVTAEDGDTGSLLDEGVYTTHGAVAPLEFVQIAFEGDPAPVVVDGVSLPNTKFA